MTGAEFRSQLRNMALLWFMVMALPTTAGMLSMTAFLILSSLYLGLAAVIVVRRARRVNAIRRGELDL